MIYLLVDLRKLELLKKIFSIHGIGSVSVDELISVIDLIKEDGTEYFKSIGRTDIESRPIDESH